MHFKLYHGVRYRYGRSGIRPSRIYLVGQTIHFAQSANQIFQENCQSILIFFKYTILIL